MGLRCRLRRRTSTYDAGLELRILSIAAKRSRNPDGGVLYHLHRASPTLLASPALFQSFMPNFWKDHSTIAHAVLSKAPTLIYVNHHSQDAVDTILTKQMKEAIANQRANKIANEIANEVANKSIETRYTPLHYHPLHLWAHSLNFNYFFLACELYKTSFS